MPSEQDYLDEIRERAIAEEDNVVHPGEPTLTGLIRVLLTDVARLRATVDNLEAQLQVKE